MPRHAYVVELKQNSHNISSRSRLASLELPPPQKKRGNYVQNRNFEQKHAFIDVLRLGGFLKVDAKLTQF